MKISYKAAIGAAAALSLSVAAVAFAHPGSTGGGMGQGRMMHGGHAGAAAGQQLMTPEEHSAMREKMHSAKTAEERQALADAHHAELAQRAKDKGITLPEGHGPRAGHGRHFTPPAAGNR